MESLSVPLVRRVHPADWPGLRDLRLEMLADTPIAFADTLAMALAKPAKHWRERAMALSAGSDAATFLGIAESGSFAGTAGGFADERGRTWVVGVYVSPRHRGRGLLARLVAAVAAWSLESGRAELLLEVAAENPRAVRAYERIGFTPTGQTRAHPIFPDVTELEMTRPA
jgi:predicted GNAT family acetyltransferase